jgi:hypothetical protein
VRAPCPSSSDLHRQRSGLTFRPSPTAMGLHNDTATFLKLSGFFVSSVGLGIWKFANQPRVGGPLFLAGAAVTVAAGMNEVKHTADEVRHNIEEGRPVTLIGGVKRDHRE